jgi:anaerobic nitric oxide reductase transcription regulator
MRKIKRGKSFAGVVQYALKPGAHHKSDPVVIGGNMLGDSALELIAEFDSSKQLRPDVQKAVWHNSLRLPDGESLTAEQWSSIADDYMERMGFRDTRSGKFEMADNGTLFLDEIGELSLSLQAKLLRVLQYGDIQRVGDDRSLRVDVRVLAATNRDLREEVLAGNFRADLFHRLSVFPLSVPPLRERGEDVVLLAGFFCEQCRLKMGLSRVVLSPGARKHLLSYGWPGNVRELEHAIHRAVVLARATRQGDEVVIHASHFALHDETTPTVTQDVPALSNENLREATEAFQRRMITRALEQNNRSWAASARALETDVANLHRLAKRLGMKG